MLCEAIARANARRRELCAELEDENPEFYLYLRMPEGESKLRVERSLWASNEKFRTYFAIGLALAGYERVV
jgi:hypothetical protein